MSYTRSVTLYCDHPDCLEVHDPGAMNVHEARRWARTDRWVYMRVGSTRYDLCDKHRDWHPHA